MQKTQPAIVHLQACIEKYLRIHTVLVEYGAVFVVPPLPRHDPKTNRLCTANEAAVGNRHPRLELGQSDLENPERQTQHLDHPEAFARAFLVTTRGEKQALDIMFDPTTGWLPDPLHGYGKGRSRAERFLVAIANEKEDSPFTDGGTTR